MFAPSFWYNKAELNKFMSSYTTTHKTTTKFIFTVANDDMDYVTEDNHTFADLLIDAGYKQVQNYSGTGKHDDKTWVFNFLISLNI
jgi:hypothetical protein